jgi:hypothetical protein
MKRKYISIVVVIALCLGFITPTFAENSDAYGRENNILSSITIIPDKQLPQFQDDPVIITLTNVLDVYSEYNSGYDFGSRYSFYINAGSTFCINKDLYVFLMDYELSDNTHFYHEAGISLVKLDKPDQADDMVIIPAGTALSCWPDEFYVYNSLPVLFPASNVFIDIITEVENAKYFFGISFDYFGGYKEDSKFENLKKEELELLLPHLFPISKITASNESKIPLDGSSSQNLTPIPSPPATGGISVIVDGKSLSFDVPPQIVNGRTMVPLRVIFEEMGATIIWDSTTQTVTATKGDTVVILTIGNTSPMVNGQIVSIDQPGIIIDGRTLAPLRYVAEAFGGTVFWDENSQAAIITTTKPPENKATTSNHEPSPNQSAIDSASINDWDFKEAITYEQVLKPYAESLGYSCNYYSVAGSHGTRYYMEFTTEKYMIYVDALTASEAVELGLDSSWTYSIMYGTIDWVQTWREKLLQFSSGGFYAHSPNAGFIKDLLLEWSSK